MPGERFITAVWRANKVCPVLIAILLLLNVAAYLIIAHVFEPRAEALQRTIIKKQSLLREVRQKGGITAAPREVYRQGQMDFEKFRAGIPHKTDFTSLIGEIFSLADKAKLSIDQIAYDPKEIVESDLLQYILVFSVTGDYGRIKKFIYSLEQSPRIIAIDDISLSGDGEPEKKDVGLRIRLSTYFKPDVA
jgi:type IV pilus assembly protein PilO